ncbi:MAG: radical SAM protein [bacterium]|nr:radical SAM protein [bacterium]
MNIEVAFKEIYHRYFDKLKEFIRKEKRVNFYNIGHDLMQNHMTAHIYQEDEQEYVDLVKILVYKNYFLEFNDQQVRELNLIWDEFYRLLDDYLVNLIEEEQPDVFGATVYNHTMPASLYAFQMVKKKYPHIETLMGGGVFMWQFPLGSSELDFFLKKTESYIDKLVVGEGQEVLLSYLNGDLPEDQRVYSFRELGLKKLSFEEIGDPDLSDLDTKQYQYLAGQVSSSCPYKCTFCTINSYFGDYVEKNFQTAVREMVKLNEKTGKQVFLLMDSLINPIIDDFSKEIGKTDKALYWDAYLRVDPEVCDQKRVLNWRRAGFFRARIGVESGSQRILDGMDKRITVDEIRKSLTSLANAGIKTTTFWVIGFPGETEEEFQMTLDLVEELKDTIYEAEFNPFTYFYAGQVDYDQWVKKSVLLYPASARDMLISQTWIVDVPPTREETFDRLNRFVKHCNDLGIPNPYSLHEVYQADERWKKLHKNAAPSLVDLTDNNNYLDECRKVEELLSVKNTKLKELSFGF